MSVILKHIANETYDIGSKINHLLVGLDKNNDAHHKKIVELCQFGKLLATYFNDYKIIEGNREEPDFIIANETEKIGVELMRILDADAVSEIGFFNSICRSATKILESDNTLPNFLANVYFKKDLKRNQNLKNTYVESLVVFVKEYLLHGRIIESEILDNALFMKHSKKKINASFGAYMQKWLTEEKVIDSVRLKEGKLNAYIENTKSPQWLVLIIGNLGESSFEIHETFQVSYLETKFDKVFVFEDFKNNLFEITTLKPS